MKGLRIIFLTTIILLLIPFIAMHFTDEVNWSLSDFIFAGILLFGAGLLIQLVISKVKVRKYRITFVIVILILLILIWAELAVGILETLFS